MQTKNTNSLVGKTILLVNTGSEKKKFILQRLKKIGLNVIVVGEKKSWAEPYVSHWIEADNYNHAEAILAVQNFFRGHRQIKVDGAVTFWEDDVLLTAKIIDKFGFIGIPHAIAKKVRNKFAFREFCEKNGISAPRHEILRTAADINRAARKLTFPLVIKPAFGASSAFVVRVDNARELRDTYEYIKSSINTESETALLDGLDIFVEEYLDGDEVDIDIVLQNGKIKFYSISDNFNKNTERYFVDRGQAIPSSLPEKDKAGLMRMAEVTLEKLGIQNAIIHFEAKVTKNGPFPIEVNMRMGGDYVYSYVKSAWGVDLVEMAVKVAIGQYIQTVEKPELPLKHIIGWDLHGTESGILAEFEIDEELKKKKYLEEMSIYRELGDPLLLPPEGHESLGWLTVSGDNMLDVQDNLKEALGYIHYRVVPFDNGSFLGKTERRSSNSVAVFSNKTMLKAAKLEKVRRRVNINPHDLHIGIVGNFSKFDFFGVRADLAPREIETELKARGYKVSLFDFGNLSRGFNEIRRADVDLVINLCEGVSDNPMLRSQAAALLESLQIPFTGSNSFTLALARDKIRMKKLLAFHNIPTPKWDYAYTMQDPINSELKFPLIVKPADADNAFGVSSSSVVQNQKELQQRLHHVVEEMGRPALVEEFIGGDEYDVVILGSNRDDLRVLPLGRTSFRNKKNRKIWDLKSVRNKKDWCVELPARNIDKKLESLITEIALDTYNIMHCHDYGRVEVRVDENDNPYVLELNANPSLVKGEAVANAAHVFGMNGGDLVVEIIKLAMERYRNGKMDNYII